MSFEQDLAIAHKHQSLIQQGFAWHGVPLYPTEGKHPFDFFLPDGRSVEAKLDLMSCITGNACLELPTLNRAADFYVHTLCFTKVFSFEEYRWLFNRGKIPARGVGDFAYQARLPSRLDFKSKGMFLDQFARALTKQAA